MLQNKNLSLLVLGLLMIFSSSCDRTEESYWPEGELKSKISYDRNGKMHGDATWFYQNGKPEAEAQYVHGELHGTMSRWLPNGNKVAEDHYRHGEMHGPSLEWDYKNQKVREQYYKDGKLHGKSSTWHTSGNLREMGEYYEGKLHGTWLYWDVAGNLVGRGEYENGDGYQYLYTPFGTEIGRYRFEDNEPVDPDYPPGIY
jgi:antitoxin component YwqK of YwqJK toxin-antitoxin module